MRPFSSLAGSLSLILYWSVPAAAVPAGANCLIEQAHYVLRQKPSVTLDFRDVPITTDWRAGITMKLTSGEHHRSYWFLPYGGNGQGIATHLMSAEDPGGENWVAPDPDGKRHHPYALELDYISANADYSFDQGFDLRRGARAPAHLFIPNLQTAFWYDGVDPEVVEGMPYSFFDLVSCG